MLKHLCRTLVCVLVLCGLLSAPMPLFAQERLHTVERGDSLALIAQHYGVTQQGIMALNGLSDPNVIYIGQQLLIPGNPGSGSYGTPATSEPLPANDGYHIVLRGETLSQLAQQYDMALSDLMRLNGITNPSTIYVGQRLRVSARAQTLPVVEPGAPQVAEQIHIVQPGESLYAIAKTYDTTPQALLTANGLPNPNFIWAGQRLRIRSEQPLVQAALSAAGAPEDGERWIEVNLTTQTLTAWQGDVAVLHTSISSGTDRTPTVTGRYKINRKYTKQRMTGPDYDLPNVPWVMYFYSGYAIHGAYWHNKFGTQTSHGCVNMRIEEAEMLYHWAEMGTEVYVHY
jgi:LysM repeat protein